MLKQARRIHCSLLEFELKIALPLARGTSLASSKFSKAMDGALSGGLTKKSFFQERLRERELTTSGVTECERLSQNIESRERPVA